MRASRTRLQATVKHLLGDAARQLREAGVDTPLLDAEIMLSDVMRVSRTALLTHPERQPGSARACRFQERVNLRALRMPLAYILGHKEFHGLDFAVTPAVLIPRPETEVLVEVAVRALSRVTSPVIAEIGAGSAAVAVALAKRLPGSQICATDCSEAALEIALSNVKVHEVANRVELLWGDLLEPFCGTAFDAVISNPPYIPSGEIPALQPEIQYEPYQALDGGPDGLECYRRIVPSACGYLKPGGGLFLEVGHGQAAGVKDMVEDAGYGGVTSVCDYSGVERVVMGRWAG